MSFRFCCCLAAPSKVGRCCCCCPWGFVPQGKLFFCPQCFVPQYKLFFVVSTALLEIGRCCFSFMVLGLYMMCSLGFRPLREAGAASMLPRSPAGEGLLSSPGFRPQWEALRRSSWFRPPREAGAASMLLRSPAVEGLLFVPGVSSPRGSSSSLLRVSSPKGSWGGVDVQ